MSKLRKILRENTSLGGSSQGSRDKATIIAAVTANLEGATKFLKELWVDALTNEDADELRRQLLEVWVGGTKALIEMSPEEVAQEIIDNTALFMDEEETQVDQEQLDWIKTQFDWVIDKLG